MFVNSKNSDEDKMILSNEKNLNEYNSLNNENEYKNTNKYSTGSTAYNSENQYKEEFDLYNFNKLNINLLITKNQFNNIIEKLQKNDVYQNEFLKNHNILDKHRAKLIDWMIEVIVKWNQKEDILFKFIQIMDSYFLLNNENLKNENLLPIGCIAFVLASKNQEIENVNIHYILDNLLKNKFDLKYLLDLEIKMLEKLDFKLNSPNMFDSMKFFIKYLEIKEYFDNEKFYSFFNYSVFMVLKMVLFDYQILKTTKSIVIIACSLIMSLKIINKMNPNLKISHFNNKIMNLLELDKNEIHEKILEIHSLSISFDEKFHNLKNLKLYFNYNN